MRSLFIKAFVAGFCLTTSYAFAAELITAKEARLPDAGGSLATRGISRGPGIKVICPTPGIASVAPFEFKLEFSPRSGAPIDPSSVKVVYMKSPMVDLTPRVRSVITSDGIDYKDAQVPPGDHQLKVSVMDTEGREGIALINLSVVK